MVGICLSASARDISDLLRDIETNNIELRAVAAGNKADIYDLKAANLPAGPSVEYSPFYRSGTSGIASSELIVSQEFDFPTLYIERNKARRHQSAAIQAGYQVARQQVLLSACLSTIDYISLDETRSLMEKRIAIADSLLHLYERRLANGDATILDLNRIKLEQMNLRTALVDINSSQAEIAAALKAINGDIHPDLDGLSYPAAGTPLAAFDASGYLDSDKTVNAARAALSASERQVSISKQSWLPSLSIGYRRNTEMKESSNGFMVGASFPLYSASTGIRASKARATQSRLQLDDAIARAQADITSAVNRVSSLRKSMDAYDIPLMEQTLILMGKSVDHGNMSITEYYLEADKIYEKWQTYLKLRSDYYKALATLNKNTL